MKCNFKWYNTVGCLLETRQITCEFRIKYLDLSDIIIINFINLWHINFSS
jgi:hypothetical protein